MAMPRPPTARRYSNMTSRSTSAASHAVATQQAHRGWLNWLEHPQQSTQLATHCAENEALPHAALFAVVIAATHAVSVSCVFSEGECRMLRHTSAKHSKKSLEKNNRQRAKHVSLLCFTKFSFTNRKNLVRLIVVVVVIVMDSSR